ncbi:hypothetical protein [Saccharothrix sp. Mg75]|uniref:hypothetical protein n=1 Tax=Saccharothrix sp. Mg75 TaxID=3445357 RepID=UPI003EE95CFE
MDDGLTDEQRERLAQATFEAGRTPPKYDDLVLLLLVSVPLVILFNVLLTLVRGVGWLVHDSWLGFLFPVAGDSPTRVLLSSITLALLGPGLLVMVARALRTTRWAAIGTLVLSPLAVPLAPTLGILLYQTWASSTVGAW